MTPEDIALVVATGLGAIGLATVLGMLYSAHLSRRRRRRELESLRDDPEDNPQ